MRVSSLWTASAAALALAVTGPAKAQPVAPAAPPVSVKAWDNLVDGIRDLPTRMLAKLPVTMQQDPQVQQEIARLALATVSMTGLDMIGSDADHPAFVPVGNFAINVAEPNPDTIYRAARITPGGTYRISGRRGNLRMINLGQSGPLPIETGFVPGKGARAFHDMNTLKVDRDGRYEVILSPERPAGYKGDWWKLEPGASRLALRLVSSDWSKERDPTVSIERLDQPVSRQRVAAEVLARNLEMTAKLGSFMAMWFVDRVEQLRSEGYVNKLKMVDIASIGGLAGQVYYEGAYELAEDEALLIEVRAPTVCEYRSLILTNEIFETADWLNNQSSLNDSQAKADSDGMLRIVVSAKDPGVPNWLDTAGNPRGAVQGRWTNCNAQPTPTVRKVPVAQVRGLLPAATPTVTPEQRERIIRERRAAYQQRPLW